jgi:hypothetical protein
MMTKEKLSKINFVRVFLVALTLISVGGFVMWDYHRLSVDFNNVLSLLRDVRLYAAETDKDMAVRFADKNITVRELKSDNPYNTLKVQTLYMVNYETKLGKDIIVFTGIGTSPYNLKVHGGDLLLKSWLGFKKYIWVNCTGFAKEGRYPTEDTAS